MFLRSQQFAVWSAQTSYERLVCRTMPHRPCSFKQFASIPANANGSLSIRTEWFANVNKSRPAYFGTLRGQFATRIFV